MTDFPPELEGEQARAQAQREELRRSIRRGVVSTYTLIAEANPPPEFRCFRCGQGVTAAQHTEQLPRQQQFDNESSGFSHADVIMFAHHLGLSDRVPNEGETDVDGNLILCANCIDEGIRAVAATHAPQITEIPQDVAVVPPIM